MLSALLILAVMAVIALSFAPGFVQQTLDNIVIFLLLLTMFLGPLVLLFHLGAPKPSGPMRAQSVLVESKEEADAEVDRMIHEQHQWTAEDQKRYQYPWFKPGTQEDAYRKWAAMLPALPSADWEDEPWTDVHRTMARAPYDTAARMADPEQVLRAWQLEVARQRKLRNHYRKMDEEGY